MTQIIVIKSQISQMQLDILLLLLKSWGIEAEVKKTPSKRAKKPASESAAESGEKDKLFSKSLGIWKDRDIDAKKLRMISMGLIDRDEE
jgi:hypothetical protein